METQDTSGFSSGEVYFSPTWSSGAGSSTLVGASTLGHPRSPRLLLSHVLRSPNGLRCLLTPQPPSAFQPAGRNLDYRKGDRWSQLSFKIVSQGLPQSIPTSSRWPDFTTSLGKLTFILSKHELHENACGCVRLSGFMPSQGAETEPPLLSGHVPPVCSEALTKDLRQVGTVLRC